MRDESTDKFQLSALKFLFEYEQLDHPQLINQLKINILTLSSSINEVEFLISKFHRAMFIYLDLSWWGRKVHKERLEKEALTVIKKLLPNIKIRVTSDRGLFDLAADKAKRTFEGVKNDTQSLTTNNTEHNSDKQ